MGALFYHYDVRNDVLYLRLLAHRDDEVYGEEDASGSHVMRLLDDDQVVGLTVVGYWRQYGTGGDPLSQPDWQQAVERSVAGLGAPLLAA
ncbi:MAG: hypothetical protein HZB16_11330 [Armatimonadetes bacterium]|nr:hypothetical protein [Armatimonadota bacterium]